MTDQSASALIEALGIHWQAQTQSFADPVASKRCFAELIRRYTEPGRHYHTLEHICSVLIALNDLPLPLSASQARNVRLAAWYHDAVYTTSAPITTTPDEERSAVLAQQQLNKLGLGQEDCTEVARMIATTQGHLAQADDPASVLLDADLSILGAPPELYAVYAEAIRCEYGWVSPHRYVQGRKEILTNLLERPAIYVHQRNRDLYEAQARVNLTAELSTLS